MVPVNLRPALATILLLSGVAAQDALGSDTPKSVEVASENQRAVRDISTLLVDEDKLRQAVASRTLTWLTGSSSNNDYVSVGRLANFFGFVALRVSSGHSLSRSAVAKETLHVLSPKQQAVLMAVVEDQKIVFEEVRAARFEMNRALEGLLVGEPLTRERFLELGENYGAAEAKLGQVIGQQLGIVSSDLSTEQKLKLTNIRRRHISGDAGSNKIRGIKTDLSKADKKELINIAARLLSWTTGDPSDNDFEVVGKPSQHFGFVSLRIESNHGVKRGEIAEAVLDMLSPSQRGFLDAAATQNIDIFDDFMKVRAKLMRAFEVALSGKMIDGDAVERLGRDMGRLEADMTWAQAIAMLAVRDDMSEDQRSSLLALRETYTGGGDIRPKDPLARGRQLYAQCVLCHGDSGASIGPSLTGIVGQKIANQSAYKDYSKAMINYGAGDKIWDDAALSAFLKSPKDTVPGTYMGYRGLENAQDREAIIAYMKSRE